MSAQVGAYYYLEKSNNGPVSNSSVLCNYLTNGPTGISMIAANVLISYGNGTMQWYNETAVPSSWNAYALTMYLAKCNVQARFYGPPLNEHFVTAINGVSNQGSFSWSIWMFCQHTNAWAYSQVGVDMIRLANGQALAWAYGASSPSSNPQPPIPNAKTVTSCS
ncbi:hypothetical protein AUI06_01435 [archaeon 13_2_20CM_2_52_21]|nr:MAG: hypothetical protein AUI06_01435 [archaeon 13_2_20CM_2_52_21]